ncbi:MAG: hypothetical protein AAGF85_19160 [Bacteroidota bacterium]
MKKLLILISFVYNIDHTSAQTEFPTAWIGDYEGEMVIGNIDKPSTTAQVEYSLHEVIEDSVWSHKMTFKSDEYGDVVKDYVIRARKKGDRVNFILDELNGIEMEMSFMDNCLYGLFMLNESSYVTTFRWVSEGSLLWDLHVTAHDTKKVNSVASGEGEEKQIFEVSSYKPALHQTVMFKKKN